METLFARFDGALCACGFLAMRGQIIDATIVAAPKQRNTKDEKQAIREGRIPDGWKDKLAKIAQEQIQEGGTLRRYAQLSAVS